MTASQRRETLSRPTGLPGRDKVPNQARVHLVTFLGEFVGTFAFLFFAFAATQISSETLDGNVHGAAMYSALAFGASLAVNVWVFFRISGGLFNPAVAIALAMVGAITWFRATICFIAEMLGAMCAAAVVSAFLPGWLLVDTTIGGINLAQAVFFEMFLTAELIFTILMLAAEKHRATFMAPIGIGMALFITQLAGGRLTGASVNPARSFAPCVVNRYFPTYHWVYWLGPFLGAVLAVLFYKLIKALEYELANPGADDTASVYNARRQGYDGNLDEVTFDIVSARL